MDCTYATLDSGKLEKLQETETQLQRTLLAYDCRNMQPAELSPEQLKKIQELEKELGTLIVAF